MNPRDFTWNHARFEGCKEGSSEHSNPSNAMPHFTNHDETKCKYKGCMDVTVLTIKHITMKMDLVCSWIYRSNSIKLRSKSKQT